MAVVLSMPISCLHGRQAMVCEEMSLTSLLLYALQHISDIHYNINASSPSSKHCDGNLHVTHIMSDGYTIPFSLHKAAVYRVLVACLGLFDGVSTWCRRAETGRYHRGGTTYLHDYAV